MMYGEKLKNLREENEIKQENLAKILGITQSIYSHYENEYYIIPIKHLNILSNYFNVSIDYLFNLTNTKNYPHPNKEIDLTLSGKRLKELRQSEKLTQEKLANNLNILRQTISNYEKGKSIIATPFLYTICKKYHISADYLLGKIDSK